MVVAAALLTAATTEKAESFVLGALMADAGLLSGDADGRISSDAPSDETMDEDAPPDETVDDDKDEFADHLAT